MFTFPILADVQLLHIPDGFLSLPMAIIAWVITAVILIVAVRQAQELFDERLIPLAGIMAAFIFAGQMLNFPVAGGTSGHLIGAALAVIVLGPWLGILAMTAVIALQALLFQDGGLVVMGANILIMGIVPAFVGYGLYRLAAQRERRVRLAVAGGAAWLSVVTAAFITALLLGFSGASAFRFVIPAMLGVHALIGVGEALITIAALSFITQARPDLLADKKTTGRGRGWVIGGVIISLLVVLLAPLASAFPDGLEWVAEQQGFIDAAQEAPYQILPDYTVPGLGETAVSTILAGIIGAVIVLLITAGVTRALRQSGRAQ
jgi:cobalt/nickel transport system permease protein